jgi:hypothetical protein
MIKSTPLAESASAPICLNCVRAMQLAGVEWETERDDLYTFDCPSCDAVETRTVTCQ